MTITAIMDDFDAVTLTFAHQNATSDLGVPDAENFANDLAATFNPEQGDMHSDAYNIVVTAEGVTVEVYPHSFPIPWQHIASVIKQLQS